MKTPPCPNCGSTTKKYYDVGNGTCLRRKDCEARRCQRRQDEDNKRRRGDGKSLRQCSSTFGHTSVRFCLLREKHTGFHLNGSVEWMGDGKHPAAMALFSLAKQTQERKASER